MNNLTIGGIDPRTGEPFTYYETIAGGMGARPGKARGFRRSHTHDEFAKHAGRGAGVCVSATSASIFAAQRQRRPRTVLWRRRNRAGNRSAHRLRRDPVGRSPDSGTVGSSGRIGGATGAAFIKRRDGSIEKMGGKFSARLRKFEQIKIETPGGGGWGKAAEK